MLTVAMQKRLKQKAHYNNLVKQLYPGLRNKQEILKVNHNRRLSCSC